MQEYLDGNKTYWERGYEAPNVDHHMFRFFGRILRPDFGLPREGGSALLDFGCGQGAAVNYFRRQGFDSEGVDMSENDIAVAKHRFADIEDSFSLCHPDPKEVGKYGSRDDYEVITAFQSLYYFTKSDFEVVVQKLHNQLRPGGVFFATMMGTNSREFWENSVPTEDEWLRKVDYQNSRMSVSDYYMFFVESEADLIEKFGIFKPVHVGYYSAKLRSDEGDGFHYTFCGVKE